MTDLEQLIAPTCEAWADLLAEAPAQQWDAPSLCEGWSVRHVVAHVTMPVRLTPEQFGAEMAASGGDFTVLSNNVAQRDASLPHAVLVEQLRSDALHAWRPPGGGAAGALSHAVIHSLDVTIPLGLSPVASADAVTAVLDLLLEAQGSWFGVDLSDRRLEATDTGRSWGTGEVLAADSATLVALLAARTLPDGRALPRS